LGSLTPSVLLSFSFFFQAEDGIRDFHVTGVQTCALPIWAKGERIRSRLEQFIGNYPELFEEVRGKGLMLGVKLKVDPRAFMQHLRDRHRLLTVAAGDGTLRLLPPLVIGDAEIDEFFDKLSAGASDFATQEPAQ